MKKNKNILLCLIVFFSLNAQAQWISDKGEVLTEKMVSELKNIDNNDLEKQELYSSMINSLVTALSEHPQILDSDEKKIKISTALKELANKNGRFHFLNKYPNKRRIPDTVQQNVLILEESFNLLRDSMYGVYNECKKIIENDELYSRASREKAANILGNSRRLEDIKYIFENDSILALGRRLEDDCWGCERSAMYNFTKEYYSNTLIYRQQIKWLYIPFIIEFWGDPNWSGQNNFHDFEVAFFKSIQDPYHQPWLLLDFIRANAKDPDTPILKTLVDFYDDYQHGKKQFEFDQKNEKK